MLTPSLAMTATLPLPLSQVTQFNSWDIFQWFWGLNISVLDPVTRGLLHVILPPSCDGITVVSANVSMMPSVASDASSSSSPPTVSSSGKSIQQCYVMSFNNPAHCWVPHSDAITFSFHVSSNIIVSPVPCFESLSTVMTPASPQIQRFLDHLGFASNICALRVACFLMTSSTTRTTASSTT